MSLGKTSGLIGLAALSVLALALPATAETVLRVAMTAADIPATDGAPDQGYEGYRFVGYTMYDTLVAWDLSSSDKAADLIPGLATEWKVDPENNKRWLFTLRQGVTYHDGCPFNADSAVWNFNRIFDETAPQFSARHKASHGFSMAEVAGVEKVDDYTMAINTKSINSLLPYNIAQFFMISNCEVEKLGYDYAKFAENPVGSGPYKFSSLVPHQRLELVANKEYWNAARIPKHDKLVLTRSTTCS